MTGFTDQQLGSIVSSGQHCTAFAASAQVGVFAFALSGSPQRLQLVTLQPSVQTSTLQQQRPAANCTYSTAAFSSDGKHLLAFCGPAQPYLELWKLSPVQHLLTAPVDANCAGKFLPDTSCCIPSNG